MRKCRCCPTYVMLTTKDNVIICDPEDEYSPLVNRLGGQVIRLSPNSRDYVNPLDINLNYSEEENPLALKSDFVLSFCELIMGSKTGLEAIEKTVIDRAVQMIYQPYFADPRPESILDVGEIARRNKQRISCLIPGFFLLCAPGFDCCAIRLEVDFRNRPPIFLRSFRHIHSPYYILLFTSFSRICPISSLC